MSRLRTSTRDRFAPLAGSPWITSSWARLAITDSLMAFGAVTLAIALIGFADDTGDAAGLLVLGGVCLLIGLGGRRTFVRARRPAPGKILSGLALVWAALVLAGTAGYLATGTIDRVDDAVVEAAAGFATTSVTTLDPAELSVPMQLWRGATQWVGGLVGVVAGVVALPMALGHSALTPQRTGSGRERLVPSPLVGRRRILAIYLGFTAACGIAYAAVGMGARESVVHAMTTVSTGGFSTRADSFASFGGGPRIVATASMLIAGLSFFVLWWLARGKVQPLFRSVELRSYLTMVTVATTVVVLDADGISLGDALFTVASACSTTGFAVGDWTVLPDAALAILLVAVATGSMTGSAGAGLRILRARVLVRYAARELRLHLDPHAVVVVKLGDDAIEERALERMTGYQIAHLGLCGLGAFALAAFEVDVLAAIWSSISAVSTFGPGLGTGPFGQLEDFSQPARLVLVPLMLAGRLSVLPVLLGVVWLARGESLVERRIRRSLTKERS